MSSQLKCLTKLKGAKVLVIGGSSGIGYAVAEALVEHGAIVAISSSKQERVDKAVKTIKANSGTNISGYACDLANQDQGESNLVALFEKVGGPLDHIVFTAGDAISMVPIDAVTPESIRAAGQVRFFVPLLVAKHAPKYIKKSPKSSITFTGGVTSDRPIPGWTVVSAFAAGIEGAVRGLAVDLKPVRVNLVKPGVVDTNLYATSGIPDEMKHGIFAQTSEKLPIGKVGRPDEVAEAYLYFMKDGNVTGELLNSNGGQMLV